MKYIKRRLRLDECSHIMNNDGSLDMNASIGYRRCLKSLVGNDLSMFNGFIRAQKCSRKKKKFYKKWFRVFFVLPIEINRMLKT